MITVLKVAAFLRRNHEPCRHWPKKNLIGWLRWLFSIRAVACVTEGHELVGVGIARPVCSLADGMDHYIYADGGTILFVDMAVAKNARATALLLKIARQRWGERVLIAFHRKKWARMAVLPWREFMSRFTRKENEL